MKMAAACSPRPTRIRTTAGAEYGGGGFEHQRTRRSRGGDEGRGDAARRIDDAAPPTSSRAVQAPTTRSGVSGEPATAFVATRLVIPGADRGRRRRRPRWTVGERVDELGAPLAGGGEPAAAAAAVAARGCRRRARRPAGDGGQMGDPSRRRRRGEGISVHAIRFGERAAENPAKLSNVRARHAASSRRELAATRVADRSAAMMLVADERVHLSNRARDHGRNHRPPRGVPHSPLGVERGSARFTWWLTTPRRGLALQSWRLACRRDTFAATSLRWDSGASAAPRRRRPHGGVGRPGAAPLASNTRYHWRVEGIVADGSMETAGHLRTGLLNPGRLSPSAWITGGLEQTLLREGIRRAGRHKNSDALASGIGYFEAELNGVEGGRPPARRRVDRLHEARVLRSFDVGGMLNPGSSNALGVSLGNGWWSAGRRRAPRAAPARG